MGTVWTPQALISTPQTASCACISSHPVAPCHRRGSHCHRSTRVAPVVTGMWLTQVRYTPQGRGGGTCLRMGKTQNFTRAGASAVSQELLSSVAQGRQWRNRPDEAQELKAGVVDIEVRCTPAPLRLPRRQEPLRLMLVFVQCTCRPTVLSEGSKFCPD